MSHVAIALVQNTVCTWLQQRHERRSGTQQQQRHAEPHAPHPGQSAGSEHLHGLEHAGGEKHGQHQLARGQQILVIRVESDDALVHDARDRGDEHHHDHRADEAQAGDAAGQVRLARAQRVGQVGHEAVAGNGAGHPEKGPEATKRERVKVPAEPGAVVVLSVCDSVAEESEGLEPGSHNCCDRRPDKAQTRPRTDAVNEDIVTTSGYKNRNHPHDRSGKQNSHRLQVLPKTKQGKRVSQAIKNEGTATNTTNLRQQ
ncbi:unnamed protein product [Phytophthora fragariaefolia]|uniref:Unnamed protein product n=1 Tax=Phytophthora fragariaefolia TaxID=1490495 RepID=A0A9W6XRA8_9STRA|nr:unnamed protein product [Phytophthora fragariaefolia]